MVRSAWPAVRHGEPADLLGAHPHPARPCPAPHPRPPLQPFHLSGPPGAWNIVTSAPGSLPPPIHVYGPAAVAGTGQEPGVELQFGPRLPLPPLTPHAHNHPFPPRRRPGSAPPGPDLRPAQSAPSPATERVDQLAEEEILVVDSLDNLQDLDLDHLDTEKTDILSDDKLTILQVGPGNDISPAGNSSTADTDYRFVILHKLPNGDAVNLENLQTYNYAELVSGDHSVVAPDSLGGVSRPVQWEVPRRIGPDRRDPYIVYQLGQEQSGEQTGGTGPPAGVRPVYRPGPPSPAEGGSGTRLGLPQLSLLSQLARVSVTGRGPQQQQQQQQQQTAGHRLTVQLLPPRLSAVLSHLEPATPRHARQQQQGGGGGGLHRQNKVAPAWKAGGRGRQHGRRLTLGAEYLVTRPYQTQVINCSSQIFLY